MRKESELGGRKLLRGIVRREIYMYLYSNDLIYGVRMNTFAAKVHAATLARRNTMTLVSHHFTILLAAFCNCRSIRRMSEPSQLICRSVTYSEACEGDKHVKCERYDRLKCDEQCKNIA
ncbi:hypothetical protein TNCV_4561561 [Trichonephila clavipes]|nr:hypothetical protein TNCV_4561561 [Trichonephila clavipes]